MTKEEMMKRVDEMMESVMEFVDCDGERDCVEFENMYATMMEVRKVRREYFENPEVPKAVGSMFDWALDWLNENVRYEDDGTKMTFFVVWKDFEKAIEEERSRRGMPGLKDGGVSFGRQAMVKFRKLNEDCIIKFR